LAVVLVGDHDRIVAFPLELHVGHVLAVHFTRIVPAVNSAHESSHLLFGRHLEHRDLVVGVLIITVFAVAFELPTHQVRAVCTGGPMRDIIEGMVPQHANLECRLAFARAIR
jgi:hypothetical protein